MVIWCREQGLNRRPVEISPVKSLFFHLESVIEVCFKTLICQSSLKYVQEGEKLKRIATGIIVVSLFLSLFALTFNIQPGKSRVKTVATLTSISDRQNSETSSLNEEEYINKNFREFYTSKKLDLRNQEDLRRFARCDQDSVELTIGVDMPSQQIEGLRKLIFKEGGKIVDTFSIGKVTKAIMVKVSIDYAYSFAEKLLTNNQVRYVEPNTRVEAFFTPNDPNWNQQWGPKKIEADWAWNTTVGSSDILVAIVDTGIDYTHPDLSPNYVPLGYDWVNNDTDPIDDHGHGTHCAGIVAAKINNNVGIAGVAQVHVMAEKVLGADGYGWDTWVAEGVIHATAQGAKVISMSLGGEYSDVMQDAVRYAYDHGVLLVAAAGNQGSITKWYPAGYDEVLAVSATDSTDQLASFSSYGEWIEVSAPGVDVYSTIPSNSYASWSGTSMAAPHVAGVAALIWSAFPHYTRDQVRRLLEGTADDLGESGFDEYYGYGRVNARNALEGLPEHDIRIVKWEYPFRLDPGQKGVFNTTICNYGRSNETNVHVQFLVNGTLAKSTLINFSKEGNSTVMSFSWETPISGNYNVTGYVVPVSEENQIENNVVSSDVSVRFPTILRVPQDYVTVKAAINKAGPKDTVLVSEGYYAEGRIDIVKGKDYLTLVGNGNVTIDGHQQDHVLNVIANHVTIKGLIIENSSNGRAFFGINVQGQSATIINNTIRKNSLPSAQGGGINVGYSCNNNISLNKIAENGFYGIYIWYSSYNVVALNTVIANHYRGILVIEGSHNIITRNYVADHALMSGIQLFLSSSNTVTLNTVINNRGGIVIDDYSKFNTVSLNNVTANLSASLILTGSENTVSSNDIVTLDSATCDIELINTANYAVSHNNFMRNPPKIFFYGENFDFWDSGYPVGGNYWSNYTGVDNFSGPYQNITGSDGIGDTPFILDADNTDNYPLMAPFKTFNAFMWNNVSYNVNIVSNSSIVNFNFDRQDSALSFDVKGKNDTMGFCRVIIPKNLMWSDNLDEWMVTVAVELTQCSIIEDNNYTYIYFTCSHSAKTVQIKSTHAISIHDVAVTDITPSKTVVVEGDSTTVNITVKNEGSFEETFNVTLYGRTLYGSAWPIYTFTGVTLAPGSTTTLTISGLDFSRGFYVLSFHIYNAYVSNTYTGVTVLVVPSARFRPWSWMRPILI